jgi:hypothetical protein
MFSGIFEAVVGVVMIAVPEPATTGAGVVMVADGVRRIADAIDEI